MPDQRGDNFDRLLIRYRTSAGLTQAELAERAGISVEAVSTLERGKRRLPRWSTVGLLADALNLDEEAREAFISAARDSREPVPDREKADGGRDHHSRLVRTTGTTPSAVDPGSTPHGYPFVARDKQRIFRTTAVAVLALLVAFGWSAAGRPLPMEVGRTSANSLDRPVAIWGSGSDHVRALRTPEGIAVAPDGDVYVTDGQNNCVDKFSSSGQLVAQWGAFHAGPDKLRAPHGIAVDQQGNVYVADYGNKRIEKFSPAGKIIGVWPVRHTGDNLDFAPWGIAVDTRGYIYVGTGDTFAGAVVQLSPDGRSVPSWDPTYHNLPGSTSQSSSTGTGITLDRDGNIFLADAGSGVISALAPGGSGLWAWTYPSSYGSAHPSGIAADTRGRFYVPDRQDGYIRVFTRTGRLLAKFGGWGRSPRQFRSPADIAIGPKGQLYVADSGNGRIQVLSSNGRQLAVWRGGTASLGSLISPEGIAVDAHGTVFVSDAGNHRIQAFTSGGRSLAEWGDGILRYPEGLTVDAHENIYVADPIGNHIVKLSAGHVTAVWGSARNGLVHFNEPFDVALDMQGNVYVADSFNSLIQELSPAGEFLTLWNVVNFQNTVLHGDLPTDGGNPTAAGVTLDRTGNIYVVDALNDRIDKVLPNGVLAATWGRKSGGVSPLLRPNSAAVDAKGRIYVADTGNNRIVVLSPHGKVVAQWGSEGTGPGKFNHPDYVTLDRHGYIYVADTGNNRIQKFAPLMHIPAR